MRGRGGRGGGRTRVCTTTRFVVPSGGGSEGEEGGAWEHIGGGGR